MTDVLRFLPFARRAGLGAETLTFTVSGRTRSLEVHTFGPGDVVGVDPREVTRRDPAPGSIGFAPNDLAAVEFGRADLPWCVSPMEPDARGRSMPWLALLVLADGPPAARRAGAPLPVIEVEAAELPPWAELSAWAHVQVVGDGAAAPEALLEERPERALSRLVSPRVLAPRRSWRACVVPTFEAGRRAGLGQPVSDARDPTPAWTGQAAVELPVYLEWTFSTGDAFDFEELARRLAPRDLGEFVRPLEVDGAAVDAGTFPLPAVLRPVAVPATWEGPERSAAREHLTALLARRDGEGRPMLGPPLHGGTAQGTDRPAEGFLAELNLDPRYRAGAGLGAEIVRRDQERLVARAWESLGHARKAATERRHAQLADLLGGRLAERIDGSPAPQRLLVSAPALDRVRAGRAATARASVDASVLPAAVLSPAFQRLARTKGRARGALAPSSPASRATGAALGSAVTVLARRAPRIAARPPTPAGLRTWSRLRDLAKPKPGSGSPPATGGVGSRPGVGGVLPGLGRSTLSRVNLSSLSRSLTPIAPSREALAVGDFAGRYFAHRNPVLEVVRPATLDVEPFATEVASALVPRARARLAARVDLGDVANLVGEASPLVASPVDPAPLAPRLVELDPRFVLAGAQIPPDTVGVLAVDAPFVESILVGANHELLRELLWRGVPCDPRGTPLPRFFDARGSSGADDIAPVASFAPESALGSHLRGSDRAVLLITGELLRRFPDALVFACRAVIEQGVRRPRGESRLPVFRGTIGVDAHYFGFDLDANALRGGDGDPGWFVVIQERESAPRFGFDVTPAGAGTPATWSDFAWAHVPVAFGFVSVSGPPPAPLDPAGTRWGENSAHQAAIALQRPVRVAIHARLLVPEGAP